MMTAAEEQVYGGVRITADKCVEFQVGLSHVKTDATTWRITNTDGIVCPLEREIHCISSHEQMRIKKELAICLIKFEVWWQAFGVLEHQKTIQQHIMHLRYPKIHLLSKMSKSIWQMGSGDTSITNVSEQLPINNEKEAYQSTNKVH
jgi:hypothetical protein